MKACGFSRAHGAGWVRTTIGVDDALPTPSRTHSESPSRRGPVTLKSMAPGASRSPSLRSSPSFGSGGAVGSPSGAAAGSAAAGPPRLQDRVEQTLNEYRHVSRKLWCETLWGWEGLGLRGACVCSLVRWFPVVESRGGRASACVCMFRGALVGGRLELWRSQTCVCVCVCGFVIAERQHGGAVAKPRRQCSCATAGAVRGRGCEVGAEHDPAVAPGAGPTSVGACSVAAVRRRALWVHVCLVCGCGTGYGNESCLSVFTFWLQVTRSRGVGAWQGHPAEVHGRDGGQNP